MDYKKVGSEIVKSVGGSGNIESITHCMTRLRFNLKNKNIVDKELLNSIEGVLGNTYAMGQFQVIMGKNLVPVFNEIIKQNDLIVEEIINENLDTNIGKKPFTIKKLGKDTLEYIVSSITPMVSGLIAGGMVKVLLLVATYIIPNLIETSTYQILSFLSDTPFYFMPIFIAYGASKKLGCNQIYAMIVAAALIHPTFMLMVTDNVSVNLIGMPVLLVKYSNSLLPALLSTLVVAYAERFFNKIIPGSIRPVFAGAFTLVVAITAALVVLGPIGTYAGNYVVGFLSWLSSTIGPAALAVLTAFLPFMIMTGMHHITGPMMIQSIATVGYDNFFRPAFILHNMAEGGACFAVALRTKNKKLRSEAISCGIGVIAGVSEPAIFGITLRLKKPLYGVMAGGAVGGLIAGLMGAKAFSMGYASILALPIFESTIVAMLIAVPVTIIVSFIIVLIVGFEDIKEN